MKATKFDIGYVVLAFIVMLVAQQMWRAIPASEIIPYSEFQALVDGGHIQSIRITDQHISGKYREPRNGKVSFLTNQLDADLAEKLKQSGVEFAGAIESTIIRDLFERAKEHAPAIIFIDELDALGRARGASNIMGGHADREQTLNLTERELSRRLVPEAGARPAIPNLAGAT